MRRHASKAGSFFKGVLLGGIACGITALLWAPKSGKKLRQDIKDKYKHAKKGSQDALEGFCEHSQDLVQDTKKAAKNFLKGFKK